MALALLTIVCGCTPGSGSDPATTTAARGAATAGATTSVDRAALAQSRAEWLDMLVSCLRDDGYVVKQDGPYDFGVVGVDDATQDAAIAQCMSVVGTLPPEPLPTAEELARLYEAQLKAKACLESHGVTVPDAPSKQVYIDSYIASYTTGVAPWGAYATLDSIPDRVWDECPQPSLATIGDD